jgi:hypothetical protein
MSDLGNFHSDTHGHAVSWRCGRTPFFWHAGGWTFSKKLKQIKLATAFSFGIVISVLTYAITTTSPRMSDALPFNRALIYVNTEPVPPLYYVPLKSSGPATFNISIPTAFHCGYEYRYFTQTVFPEYLYQRFELTSLPKSGDLLVIGMHYYDCPILDTFPGIVFYINGEPVPGPMVAGSYYLGPVGAVQAPNPRAIQVYYATIAATELSHTFYAFRERPRGTGENFLLYVSSRCVEHREEAFRMFAEVGRVAAAGSCHGGLDDDTYDSVKRFGSTWLSGAPVYGHYKFGLVMENTDIEGYVTEKILAAFLGGTVPIYSGSREVLDVFNHEAFIYLNPSDPQAAVKQVQHLLHDPVAYEDMLLQPIVTQEQFEKYFSVAGEGLWKRKIRSLLNVDPKPVVTWAAPHVQRGGGMFLQMFGILDNYLKTIDVHGNASSENWNILGYAPQDGSQFLSGKFEDIFEPVRQVENAVHQAMHAHNFFHRIRSRAQEIFQPNSHVRTVTEIYHQSLNVSASNSLCIHVRRGDKAEGVRILDNEEIIRALQSVEDLWNSSDSTIYVLTDDTSFVDYLREHSTKAVVTFNEEDCIRRTGLNSAQCLLASVLLATKHCNVFVGSSTSHLSRFIMLLGGRFYDLDGVVDYFTATQLGKWYLPHDNCLVVDGELPSGNVCGFISPRCPYCISQNPKGCANILSSCV